MKQHKNDVISMRRYNSLLKKHQRLQEEYEQVCSEKKEMEKKLDSHKEQIAVVEAAQKEFQECLEQTKHIKEKYEEAYKSLKTLKYQYTKEMEKLLRQINS